MQLLGLGAAICIFIAIGLTEFPSLVRSQSKKNFVIYLFFYLLALSLCISYSLEIPIPKVSEGIDFILKPFIQK